MASAINERISKAVFDESVRQTKGMLDEVSRMADENGTAETNKFFDWAKKIAIHILDNAGMGDNVPWDTDTNDKPEPGFQQTYIQSVKSVIHHITGAILLPQWLLHNYPSFLPGHSDLRALGHAVDEFPVHTAKLLENERQRTILDASTTKGNILSQLLQASEGQEDSESKSTRRSKALSDTDLLGNLFVFTAAAFDSTGVSLLSSHTSNPS